MQCTNRNDFVLQDRFIGCRSRQNDIISSPAPCTVVGHVSVERLPIADEDAELLEGDKLVEERLRSDELSHTSAVGNLDAHEERQRPKDVGTDHLQ